MWWAKSGESKPERLVENQARFHEIQGLLAKARGEDKVKETELLGPFITISRQRGAGGDELARRLSKVLGWNVYDREIISAVADRAATSEATISWHDQRAMAMFDEYLTHLFVPQDAGHAAYLEKLTEVVIAIAKEGQAVILGRGANWFLTGRGGLRLRLVAPLDQRIEAVAKEEHLDARAARRSIKRADNEQAAFVRQTFGRDIEDPLGYDLVLNLGGMDVGVAALLVATAFQRQLLDQ